MAQNRKSRRAVASRGTAQKPAPAAPQKAAGAPPDGKAEVIDFKTVFQAGLAHYNAGRHAEAEAKIVFRRLIAVLEKGAAPASRDVTLAQALNALGVMMRVQHRYPEAIAL